MARMRRLLVLALAAVPALADGKADFQAALGELQGAYFDQLDADRRDRLFETLGAWDHPNAVKSLFDVASRFGAHLNALEAKIEAARNGLAAFADRTSLSLEDAGRRAALLDQLEMLEPEWRRGGLSMEMLVAALARIEGEKGVRAAVAGAPKHPSWRVRWLVAGATPVWHRKLASGALSGALLDLLAKLQADEEPRVRLQVARALAGFQRTEALALLGKSLQDEAWHVRAAAIRSLERTRANEAVPLLIEAMKRETGRLKDDANAALQRLSGEGFAWPESWEGWWKKVGQQLPAEPKAGAAERAAEERDRVRDERNRFYGIPTRSDHVCFVIDISGSMTKEVEQLDVKKVPVITGRKEVKPDDLPAEGKTRIEVAKNELKRAIRNLPPRAWFSIVFFNHGVKVWRPEMTQATPGNKEAVLKDLESVTASGATWTLGALQQAFTMAGTGPRRAKKEGEGIDTIFLLSDGGPTNDDVHEPVPMDPEKVLEAVRTWNQDAGLVIHAIAVDTEDVGTYFLKQIAAQNGGAFVERRQ